MAKQLTVKKDNALVAASYNLTLGEQRLILLAIAAAGHELDARHVVTAEQYADCYKLTAQGAYRALREASLQLFERRYTVRTDDKTKLRRWVSGVDYVEGAGQVVLHFAPDVLEYLGDLKNRFTAYALERVASLTSAHAVRLYELLISWRSVGKTPVFELATFREQLGILPDEYKEMANFKRRVLDVAIKQINEHTDLMATYEQHKQGRRITGLSFSFAVKQPDTTVKAPAKPAPAVAGRSGSQRPATGSDLPMPDYLQDAPDGLELTGEQRRAFAGKLAKDPGKLPLKASKGESEQQYAARIEAALRDSLQAARWLPHLRRVGFRVAR